MAYNAVIQLPALFDVDGGSAALFGEQQVVDVMNSHLLFTLDRQSQLGNGKLGYRAPASDTDLQSLVEAFNDTFLVSDTSMVNNDADSSNAESAVLGSGLLADLGAADTASHPAPDSNVATGTFPNIKVKFDNTNAAYVTSPNFLTDTAGESDIANALAADTDGHYYYDDSDGVTKGGAIVTLHYISGALNEIEVTTGGNGYVVGDKVTIDIPASIVALADGVASQLKITLTAASINSEAGKIKFFVNMIGNSSGAYLPKYSEGTGQIAGPKDVVDDFCNKFADCLIKAHSSGYVNIPHPEKAIPMGGRTVTDGKAPLYESSICPEAAEKCSLGTTMARAAAVHLVGHPLAQSLFSNENSIVNELSSMIQEENSTDFEAGAWVADAKFDADRAEDADGTYGEMGYGSELGGNTTRVGKQGFRFKSKLAKILSKLLGGSQSDTRKYTNAGLDDQTGTDNSLKAGNGYGQTYKHMKKTETANAGVYEQVAEDIVAPSCVQFAVKADVEATAGKFTHGLKAVIDEQGNYYDHTGSISTSPDTLTEVGFPKDAFGDSLTQTIVVAADSVAVERNGEAAPDTAKDAVFVVVVERSAVADTYTVSVKKVTASISGEGYQSGDVLTLVLNDEGQELALTINGDNLIQSHLGNISPHKIADDHVANSTMAAYNFIGVPKEHGVHNSVLQAIYEQCLNVPGRATELDNGRGAVITAVPSGSLTLDTVFAASQLKLTAGEVYGADATVEINLADLEMKSQFTSGADLSGAGAITVTIVDKLVTEVKVTTAGGAKLHAGDVIYVQSGDIGQGTGDIEITLASGNLTPDDQTGAHDKPYKDNIMLTRNLASTNVIPAKFPMKAGDKLVCYLRPSLLLKFDQTLLQGDVNVQYIKSDGSLETLDVNGIVNSSATGQQGSISTTFPGLAFDANDDGDTLQEWEDKAIANTAQNFVGKKVINHTHAQSGKFCWMGSSVNSRSDTSTAANTALDAVDATPAHTLQARQDAITKPVTISQQLTDESSENKLDLHVWKVTMSM